MSVSLGPSPWVSKYLGVPFVPQGFDLKGLHCWGLIWLVYREQLGVELNKYLAFTADDIKTASKLFHEDSKKEPWHQYQGKLSEYEWKDFDVLVMASYGDKEDKHRRYEGHVGLVAGRKRILHTVSGVGSACIQADHPYVRNKILGVYRHWKTT